MAQNQSPLILGRSMKIFCVFHFKHCMRYVVGKTKQIIFFSKTFLQRYRASFFNNPSSILGRSIPPSILGRSMRAHPWTLVPPPSSLDARRALFETVFAHKKSYRRSRVKAMFIDRNASHKARKFEMGLRRHFCSHKCTLLKK